GIGEAIARALGQQGAAVCLTGRNGVRLRKIARRMRAPQARFYPADLTGEREVRSLVKKILADHQRVDALVHCAAIILMDAIATASVKDFDRQLQTNVLAPFRLTQLLLPALIAAQGQVVFTNSSAGLTARAGVSQYSATKHALKALANSLREECNSAGVRVCSLFLGATATPMQAAVRTHQKRSYAPDRIVQPDDVAAITVALLALPRTAEVTDVMMRPMMKT
ncbi:MAG: SDR family NAD(P)-dependent oxidoreductase, partial [Candidatus Acidiferrum sp.]